MKVVVLSVNPKFISLVTSCSPSYVIVKRKQNHTKMKYVLNINGRDFKWKEL